MARFIVIRNGDRRIKACVQCGKDNFFRHSDKLFTCNYCGHTAEELDKVEDVIEEVVTRYGGNQ